MPDLPEVETARSLIAERVTPAHRRGGTCPRCGAEMRHGTVIP